jgi:O-antigen/teichoic acid export membrane protein
LTEETEDVGLAVKYARSTSIGWLRIILVRGVQIVYIYFIARWLLPDEMGYVQIFAIGLSFLGAIVTPWIGWTLQQKALSNSDPEQAQRIIHRMTLQGIIIGLIFAPITAILYLLTTSVPIWSMDAIIFIFTLVALSLIQLFVYVYQTYLKIELSVLFGAIQTVFNFIIPLILFYFTDSVSSIFWGWLIADTIVLIFMILKSDLIWSRNYFKLTWPTRTLLIFALPVFLNHLFNALRTFIDRYIILIFFTLTDLANYHLVTRITGIAQQAILTLLIPFFPIMTMVFQKRRSRAKVALGATTKMLSLAILFVAPIFAFAGLPIIGLILGEQYLSVENQMLLSVATLTMVFFAYAAMMINIRGAKGETYKVLALQTTYVIGFSIFLSIFFLLGWVESLQVFGVALSLTFGYFFAFCIFIWQTPEMRLLGKKTLVQLVSLGVVQILVVFSLSLLFAPLDLIDTLIITGISFPTLLLFSALFSMFTEEEMEIISRVSNKRLDFVIRLYQKIGIWEPKRKPSPSER